MFGLAWVGLAVAGVALLLSRLPAAAMGGHGPSPLMDPHCSVAGAALRDEATSSASSHLPGGRHLCPWVGIAKSWFATLEKKHFLAGGAPCSTDGGAAPMAKGGPGKPLKM